MQINIETKVKVLKVALEEHPIDYCKIHVFYRRASELKYTFDKVLIDQYVEYANTSYSLNCTWYAKFTLMEFLKQKEK